MYCDIIKKTNITVCCADLKFNIRYPLFDQDFFRSDLKSGCSENSDSDSNSDFEDMADQDTDPNLDSEILNPDIQIHIRPIIYF